MFFVLQLRHERLNRAVSVGYFLYHADVYQNIDEKVIEYIRSPVVYIFVHE